MILVDTSIWVTHLHSTIEVLAALMERKEAATHPFVIGEVAMGSVRQRDLVIAELRKLPSVRVMMDRDVVSMIERHRLFGTGIGYIDAHLLAAALFVDDVTLWTHDRRLRRAAARLGVAAYPIN
jgi:predicted nucleic acid-binding protein